MKNDLFVKSDEQTIKLLINAVEQTADNVMITGFNAKILYVNPAFEKTTGYTREEVLDKTPKILQSGKHSQEYYHALWNTILDGKMFRATAINKKKNGDLYYCDQTITPIKNDKEEVVFFVSVFKDITERVEAENKLKKLNESLTFEKYKLEQILSFDERVSTITQLHELIDFVIHKSCEILESERCSLMLLDEDTKDLRIKGAAGLEEDVIRNCKVKLGEGVAGKVAQTQQPVLVADIESDERFDGKNKPYYKSKSFMSVPIILEKKLIGVVNISERKSNDFQPYSLLDLKILTGIVREAAVAIENARIYKELKYLANTDPMTHLFNFRHFTSTLDNEILRSQRYNRPVCLLLIDIDDFKSYNDEFGHLQGDILLKEVARMLTDGCREVDVVCRYAGDEFVIIMPETNKDQAFIVAQRLMNNMEKLTLSKPMTFSIGGASYGQGTDRRDLIMKTDQALYEAKNKGKNQIKFY